MKGLTNCAWLAHVVKRRTAVREAEVSRPRSDKHKGLKITEEKVLPLL